MAKSSIIQELSYPNRSFISALISKCQKAKIVYVGGFPVDSNGLILLLKFIQDGKLKFPSNKQFLFVNKGNYDNLQNGTYAIFLDNEKIYYKTKDGKKLDIRQPEHRDIYEKFIRFCVSNSSSCPYIKQNKAPALPIQQAGEVTDFIASYADMFLFFMDVAFTWFPFVFIWEDPILNFVSLIVVSAQALLQYFKSDMHFINRTVSELVRAYRFLSAKLVMFAHVYNINNPDELKIQPPSINKNVFFGFNNWWLWSHVVLRLITLVFQFDLIHMIICVLPFLPRGLLAIYAHYFITINLNDFSEDSQLKALNDHYVMEGKLLDLTSLDLDTLEKNTYHAIQITTTDGKCKTNIIRSNGKELFWIGRGLYDLGNKDFNFFIKALKFLQNLPEITQHDFDIFIGIMLENSTEIRALPVENCQETHPYCRWNRKMELVRVMSDKDMTMSIVVSNKDVVDLLCVLQLYTLCDDYDSFRETFTKFKNYDRDRLYYFPETQNEYSELQNSFYRRCTNTEEQLKQVTYEHKNDSPCDSVPLDLAKNMFLSYAADNNCKFVNVAELEYSFGRFIAKSCAACPDHDSASCIIAQAKISDLAGDCFKTAEPFSVD